MVIYTVTPHMSDKQEICFNEFFSDFRSFPPHLLESELQLCGVWVLPAFNKADRPIPVSPFTVLTPGHLQQCQLCSVMIGTELAGCVFWSFICLLVFFLACGYAGGWCQMPS